MNIHKNARLTPQDRALLVRRMLAGGLRVEEAAHASGVSVRTAYKWLRRAGLMLDLDIKKPGRFQRPGHRVTGDRTQSSPRAGWEIVHVALDDHSRVAFADIQPDESRRSACRALLSPLRYYRSFGIAFRRVLTDNGG